ncbi:MAG: cation diffusion facilitator family transporter [Syntrophobacterales bacterium]|jgi:cobalt-zinc-cadmium efflux system protein|nr:cation diffusion facilitator family transporter [Syntrophobacterales bacterium]
MNHTHVHAHRFESSHRRLALAFWTQLAFCAVELVGGILTNSLALLADAGHMLSDVGALGLSLLALQWATKPATSRKTYGYHRLEILVALINGLALWAMAGYIFYEAATRLFHPPAISSTPLIIIASLGLLVNLLGMYILLPERAHSINLRSAFIHLLSDSFGSLATVVAGLAIYWRGWYWFDPVAGIVVGAMIVISSWQLVWEAAEILLESTPRHIDLNQVQQSLESHPQVLEVHDLHIWTIASGIFALSVHVTIDNHLNRDCLTGDLEELLHQRFGLEHNTIQIEGPDFHDPRVCTLHRLEGNH